MNLICEARAKKKNVNLEKCVIDHSLPDEKLRGQELSITILPQQARCSETGAQAFQEPPLPAQRHPDSMNPVQRTSLDCEGAPARTTLGWHALQQAGRGGLPSLAGGARGHRPPHESEGCLAQTGAGEGC